MSKAKPSHLAIRAEMWSRRVPQLMAVAERRPYWQFRTVDDGRDNAACQANHNRIERHDSPFWAAHAPWLCSRPDCRCTVRSYSDQELLSKGLQAPKDVKADAYT